MSRRIRSVTYIIIVAFASFVQFQAVAQSQELSAEQTDQQTRLQAAATELNTGSYNDGVSQLNALLDEYPTLVSGWILLGRTQRSKSEFEESLDTFTRGNTANPSNPAMMFQLGIAYGHTGDLDQSFKYLLATKRTNSINMTNLAALPVAAKLSGDPRYRDVFPTEAELNDPFVEGTRIIHEWRGEHARDQFSWIARNIGDVDGDEVDDLVASAPTSSERAPTAGKIYAYSGRTGALLWEAAGSIANGQLGNGVEAAGDVNADGYPDVIAGAPFASKAYVYDGRNGSILLELTGDDPTGGYGNVVKGIGDVNGDGNEDLLIGEPYQIFGSPFNGGDMQHPGNAYIVSGADGSTLLKLTGEKNGDAFGTAVTGDTQNGETLFIVGAPGAGDQKRGKAYLYRVTSENPLSSASFAVVEPDETGSSMGGMFMSVLGDVDGDSTPDIYVSDFSDLTLGPATGKVYVLSGVDGSRIHVLTGYVPGEGFGIGNADAGDVNSDGYADLVVGAWQHAGAAPSGGKVYVFSGKDGQLMHTITGKVQGETFGFDTTGMGDVDGDGIIDFLLTSTWSSVSGFQSGRMFIVSGRNGR